MPIYFFHLRDGTDILLDDEGIELESERAIAAAALREARGIIAHDAVAGRVRLDQRIDVEDGAGRIVHQLWFDDAIEIVPRRRPD